MKNKCKNVAQSVRDRLRTVTVRLRLNYNLVLTRYALERLLYRLSVSPQRNRFALKGAMLFVVWTADIIRPTQDLDLLGFGDSDVDGLRDAFRDIMGTPVANDGVAFDLDSVRAEPIRAKQPYDGVRVSARSFIGTARVPIQIDIGFGYAVKALEGLGKADGLVQREARVRVGEDHLVPQQVITRSMSSSTAPPPTLSWKWR